MPTRFWIIALFIALASACASAIPKPYNTLSIDYVTLLALAREGQELDYETAWCLIGSAKDSTVVVDGVAAPFINERSADMVNFQGCNKYPKTVGWYHNHPQGELSVCAASAMDIATTNSWPNFLIALISCDGGSFIYFFQGSTIRYRVMPNDYLYPN